MTPPLQKSLTKTKQGFKLTGTNIHIRKRYGTVNWEIAVYMPEYRRYKNISTHTNDIEEAKLIAYKQAAEMEFAAKHGIDIFPKKVEDVANSFITYIEKRAEINQETIHMSKIYIRNTRIYIIGYFGKLSINSFNQQAVSQFFSNYVSQNKMPSNIQIQQINGTLRQFFNYAKNIGLYKLPITPTIEMPKNHKPGIRDNFTDEEISIILKKINIWVAESHGGHKRHLIRFMIHFVLATGARTNDFAYLKWRDFKWTNENNEIMPMKARTNDGRHEVDVLDSYHLPAFTEKSNLHGAEVFLKVFLQGKNHKRDVICDQGFKQHFLLWKNLIAPQSSDENVFTITPFDYNVERKFFTQHAKAFAEFLNYCKIPRVVNDAKRSPYSLRHTFITTKLREGISPLLLAKQCGTSVGQIEKTYCHLLPSDLFKQIFKKS